MVGLLLFLADVLVWLIVIGGEFFFKNRDRFPSRGRDPSFFAKQCVPSPPKNPPVDFCSVNGKLSAVQQVLHFLQSLKLEVLLVER